MRAGARRSKKRAAAVRFARQKAFDAARAAKRGGPPVRC